MGIEHLAVNLPKRQRYRRNVRCPVCGETISASNCKPLRQEVNNNGEEESIEEKTSEETTQEKQ